MLTRPARLYPEREGSGGCVCSTAAAKGADPDGRALTAAAKQANCAAIRDFIATEYRDMASAWFANHWAAQRDGGNPGNAARSETRTFRRNSWTIASNKSSER
jgi:hypothetical protein